MSLRAPSLIDVIERAVNARARDTHCALPARVESYAPEKQKASVLPLVKGWHRDAAGVRRAVQLPVITGVPVVFPGAGGYRLTFPVSPGDTVLLVFADYSVDIWLKNGGVVDPVDERTHNLSDAIAIPGLRDFGHPLTTAPTEGASIGKDGGLTIEFRSAELLLGGADATKRVAYAEDVEAEISALRTAFNGHSHAVSVSGTATAQTGATTSLIGAAPAVGSVGSPHVKVK